MRTTTRRKRHTETETERIPEPTPTPPAADVNPVSTPESPVERLSIPLRHGAVDIESMRATTKDRLRSILTDPELAGKLGIAGQAVAAGESLFDPSVCGILYDALGKIAFAFAVKSGYTPESARNLLFTVSEKESVSPLTARVLDKWIPFSGKYRDEAMLAVALFGIINGKVAMLQKAANVLPFQPQPPSSDNPS